MEETVPAVEGDPEALLLVSNRPGFSYVFELLESTNLKYFIIVIEGQDAALLPRNSTLLISFLCSGSGTDASTGASERTPVYTICSKRPGRSSGHPSPCRPVGPLLSRPSTSTTPSPRARRTVVSIPNGPSALVVKEAAWGLA
ncbi:uncharacterized protein M6B38_315490 [Iris pallida]|uniref:Uncharacterized protein n=1 Tax=Iris pallida TaxID=29817 RepID=A0AAX6HFX8_IRIPA|nr:uncharacterized protein M6B38_315490 [Iris pallida]